MKRGPDGIRQHVLFVPGRLNRHLSGLDDFQVVLDEIEAWIEGTFEKKDYIYMRYSTTSSLYLFDINNAVAVKLRWHDLIMME